MAKGNEGSFVNEIFYILSKHRSEWTFYPAKSGYHKSEDTVRFWEVRVLLLCPTLEEFGT